MIEPVKFYEALKSRDITFYTGVPDSLLSDFCSYVEEEVDSNHHFITANEGNAISLAIGYHLSTGKTGVVYMQNSGLGNAVNPLTSLADSEIYKVPMLLVIGWRGEPGVKDEPQHIKQGRVTLPILDVLEIPHWIVDAKSDINLILEQVFSSLHNRNAPVALIIRKNTFSKYIKKNEKIIKENLTREKALELMLDLCNEKDIIISTTGKASRELYELRIKNGQVPHDFLTVGGMGHASSIALGVAIGQPQRRVICFDGDGSILMHMGSMPVIAESSPSNFIHVLLNNYSHESVGGQKTSSGIINFSLLSSAVGYTDYAVANDEKSLRNAWSSIENKNGPVLLEVKIKNGSRDDLGRPRDSALENKIKFMEFLGV